MADTRELVSITEAAQLLGISIRTVQRRLDGGLLEAVMVADKRMVRLTPDTPSDASLSQNGVPYASIMPSDTPNSTESIAADAPGDNQHELGTAVSPKTVFHPLPAHEVNVREGDTYGGTIDTSRGVTLTDGASSQVAGPGSDTSSDSNFEESRFNPSGDMPRDGIFARDTSDDIPNLTHDMTRDIERVTEIVTSQEHTIQQFGRDIEQIKAYIAGDLGALLRERLANLPTREDMANIVTRDDMAAIPTREDIADTTGLAISVALGPVLERLQGMEEERADWRRELAARDAQIAELEAKIQADGAAIRDALATPREREETGGGVTPPPVPIKRPWWMFWGD